MNRKMKKTGEIIAIVSSSIGVVVSIVLTSLLNLENYSGIIAFLICAIIFALTIVTCSIDLASKCKTRVVSFIFSLLSLMFALYIDRFVRLSGIYGLFYPMMKVGLITSSILLGIDTFFEKKEETIITNEVSPSQSFNVLDELNKLYSLKEKKLISEEEYNIKRAEIIDRM